MAQTGYTPISLYYSTTASTAPTAGNLVAGELAINTNDGILYYKDSSGVVQKLATKGGVGSSTTTQVLYNNAGTVAGSANLIFNGTNLGLGITPNAAWSSFSAIQLGGNTYNAIASSNSYMAVYANTYYDGTNFKYVSTAGASTYTQNGGAHYFSVASSGTAGNNITFTQAMVIDGSANVGIGTSSPAYKLDVTGSARITSASPLWLGTTTGDSYIQYGASATTANNWTLGSQGDGTFRFFNGTYSSGTERMRISSAGLVGIGTTTVNARLNVKAIDNSYTGGAISLEATDGTKSYITTISDRMYFGNSTPSENFTANINGIGLGGTQTSSGVGLKFPATQSASSDANTLDDYEEGTWTPTDNSGAGLTFVSTTFGRYIKIGRMVFATGMATYPSTASTAVLSMGGLPFVSSDDPDSTSGGYITYSQYTTNSLIINVAEPSTTFNFFYNNSTNGPTNAAMSGKQIRFSIMYTSAN